MAYIGKIPTVGNFQVCDAISVVDAQAAYTMQVGSVNVVPESANNMIVSLNGVIQKPGSSYTVSGSTITFASNLITGDVINFIQILGSVLDLGVPSDDTVSLAKLTATGTKDSTTFLRGDNTFAAAGAALTGSTNNTVVTVTGANAIVGEATLTYDGTSLSNIPSGTESNLRLQNSTTGSAGTDGFLIQATGNDVYINNYENASMYFRTNNTDRILIDSSGLVGIADTPFSGTGLTLKAPASGNQYMVYGKNGAGTNTLIITGSGNITNYYNSYGALSDKNLKQDITLANSQWNDIKSLQIKNYKLISDVESNSESAPKLLGVIAQDLESSNMSGLVSSQEEILWTAEEELPEGVNVGDVKQVALKSVKYSVLYIKAVKALQEAITRIESLETKNTELEARITTLENA